MTETAIKAKSIKGYSTYNRYNRLSLLEDKSGIIFKEADREQVEAGLPEA